MESTENIINTRFEKLIILKELTAKKGVGRMVECLCDCGAVKIYSLSALRRGEKRSCGCLRKITCTKHGMYLSSEYISWRCMLNRCYNPKNPSYRRYGELGIIVCDPWRSNFINFLTDLGLKPSKKHTIERIDGTKGYSKDNCIWATKSEQSNNTVSNVIYEYMGKKQTLSQWGVELNFNISKIRQRINKNKMSLEQALNTVDVKIPTYKFNNTEVRLCDWCSENKINYKWAFKQIHQYKRSLEDIIKYVSITLDSVYTVNHTTLKLKEWCKLSDIQPIDVKRRLMLNWSFEEAISPIAKRLITFNPDNTDKGPETFKLSHWCGLLGLDKEDTYLRMIRGDTFDDIVNEN